MIIFDYTLILGKQSSGNYPPIKFSSNHMEANQVWIPYSCSIFLYNSNFPLKIDSVY